jgi:hypothetical protein
VSASTEAGGDDCLVGTAGSANGIRANAALSAWKFDILICSFFSFVFSWVLGTSKVRVTPGKWPQYFP